MPPSDQSRTPQYLLVMTATSLPAPTAGVKRADPELRLDDYREALRFWLAHPHPALRRILLLENSGADLSSLQGIADRENPLHKQVEILSVPGNDIPEGRNYGYTEMQLLDAGLARSRLRHETTHLIKVTGRLTFPSLGRALDLTPEPFDVLVDLRKLGFPRPGFDAYTQLFVLSHSFYDRVLRDSRHEMTSTDVRLLEHLIARKVAPFRGQPGIHLRFPVNVEPVGLSGFSAKRYNTPSRALTRALRALFRKIAPDFWF
ncbi:MAG: hypothetical protein NVSMB3_05400 [Acidobacteriaceae bacterium]